MRAAWALALAIGITGGAALAQDQGNPGRAGVAPDPSDVRLEKVEKRLADIEARLGRSLQPSSSVNTVEKRLQRVEQQLAQLETRLDQLEQRLRRVETKR